MSTAAELAWLIPVLPLLGAVITGLGLISFNRTINRLRKPVALLLISCVGAAAVLSYAVLADQLAGAPPVEHLFVWASAGSFSLPMGYVVDSLGAEGECDFVTTVSSIYPLKIIARILHLWSDARSGGR